MNHNGSRQKVILINRARYSNRSYDVEACSNECSVNKYKTRMMSTGPSNSMLFMTEALTRLGRQSEAIFINDESVIDEIIEEYTPDVVLLEALWISPEKLKILTIKYPTIHWIVRLHSMYPFLGNEGNAAELLMAYSTIKRVALAANCFRMYNDLQVFTHGTRYYLPNYYSVVESRIRPPRKKFDNRQDSLHVAIPGAIRPFKNHVIQAIAAVKFCESNGVKLYLHIAKLKYEDGGNSHTNNLKHIFDASNHELVEDEWMPHHKFLDYLKTMDLVMQVSLSETFNIVAADAVSQGVPIVGSKEIDWLNNKSQANPTDTEDIESKIGLALRNPNSTQNLSGLRAYNELALSQWELTLKHYDSNTWKANSH